MRPRFRRAHAPRRHPRAGADNHSGNTAGTHPSLQLKSSATAARSTQHNAPDTWTDPRRRIRSLAASGAGMTMGNGRATLNPLTRFQPLAFGFHGLGL